MCSEESLFFDEKSIDQERIVTDKDPILKEFFCPICYCLLWKPRSCGLCQHLFCKKCIQTWLNAKSITCPLCRSPYEEKPAPPSIQSILSYFSIRCRNTSLGCREILPYGLLEQHESIDCHFLTKKCRMCEEIVLMTDIDQHKHICKPIVVQCPTCQCFVKIELFERHQNECLQDQSNTYEQFADELLVPINFANETILSTISVVDFVGIERFNQSREKNCFIRFLGMFQLILANLPMIHLILFNLFIWGWIDLVNTFETSFVYLQTWVRTSMYQIFIFIMIASIIFHYSLSFLMESVNDTVLILFIIFSLIIWSSMNSKIELSRFQMSFNFKEILLFYILIIFLFQIFILILRFYFEYIPINIGISCLAIGIILFSKYCQRSTIL